MGNVGVSICKLYICVLACVEATKKGRGEKWEREREKGKPSLTNPSTFDTCLRCLRAAN